MKNSRKKPDVEDTKYVPTHVATSESSHSSEDVPLKSKVEELRKKKKTDGRRVEKKRKPRS